MMLPLVIGLLLAAPAPMKPIPEKTVVQVRSGTYQHLWGGSKWTVTLKNGDYLAVAEYGCRWQGSYTWEPVSRCWTVTESPDGETYYTWSAVLDDDGKGDTVGAFCAPIRLWQDPK